jgi:hypothetical protein
VTVAALAFALALTLAGCVPPSPVVIPTADPTVAPIFATDADALAAAKTAYEGYLAASDAIGNDGGANAQRIAPFVTSTWLPKELASFAQFKSTGNRFAGGTTFAKFTLQRNAPNPAGGAHLTIYVCVDVSKSRLLNKFGKDITPASRTNISPIQIEMMSAPARAQTLLFDGSRPWSGSNFCA